ncbi:hypothetical protein Tco_0531823 [Tanacetum coccineum]
MKGAPPCFMSTYKEKLDVQEIEKHTVVPASRFCSVNGTGLLSDKTGKFGEHCGGNDGIGGSKFEFGEGKVVSIGIIGGGAFAIRSIVSKDGRGGGGLVVDGGRSLRVSRKALGEVGGVESNSSIGSRLMARGDVSLDGWVGAGAGEVKGGGVDLGVGGDEVHGLLKQHGLTLILVVLFKLALFSLGIVRENDENEVTNHFLL